MLVRLLLRGVRVANRRNEGIKMSQLASKITIIVRRGSTLVDLMKPFLNVTISFEKEYNKTLVESCIVKILKDVMGSHFLEKMSAKTYCRNIWVAEMALKH